MRRHPQELGQEQKGLMQRHRLPLSVWPKEGWLPLESGEDLSGPDVEDVDPAGAIATAEAPDPGVGPLGPQLEGVTSPPRVERSDSIKTTNPHMLDLETSETQTLDERTHTQVQVETRTHTRVQEAHSLTLNKSSLFSL